MNTPRWNIALIAVLTCSALPALAGIDGQDLGTAAPPATLGGFNLIPFGSDPTAVETEVTAVALPPLAAPSGSLLFDVSLTHRTIGAGGWLSWSNGYTGDVYALAVDLGAGPGGSDSLTITLPAATHAFYFYVQPDAFPAAAFDVHGLTNQGETFDLGTSVAGSAGANGFGLFTTGATASTLHSVTITGIDTWPDGYAIGQFGIERRAVGVPDGGATALLLACSLLALAALHRRLRTW